MVVVVPMKDRTFDHNRNYSTFEHLLEDYNNDVKEDDLSHLPEIIEAHDYDMDVACEGSEAFIERAKSNFENRCLHHHVFNQENKKNMSEYINLEVVNFAKVFNNYWIMSRKI